MENVAYVNGEFVPENRANVSIFDRGFIFGEGIYEVTSVLGGRLVDNDGHLARLNRSLGELKMAQPISNEALIEAQTELVRRNRIEEGVVYLQITRGPAPRDFAYPRETKPTLIMFTQIRNILHNPQTRIGIKVITLPEIRWQRRDIKTVGLLAACMGKQAALDAGADDAWFVEDGFVTEGTSNNAYVVTAAEKLLTRHLGNEILKGVTRMAVLEVARRNGITVEERPFTVEEAHTASEAFITSASTFVMPVVGIDEHTIGDGAPGALTVQLRELYTEFAKAST